MKYKVYLFVVTVIIICLYGCSGSHISETDIETSKWMLDTLNGKKVISDKPVTLEFNKEKATIAGFGGCNSYFGSYLYVNNEKKLKFSEIGSTKMACDSMQTEIVYFAALPKVEKFILKNSTLYMYGADNQALIFKKIK